MARPVKEIQVQKPAQSLENFQKTLGQGEAPQENLLKPVLIGLGVVVAGVVAFGAYKIIHQRAVERHQTSLAELIRDVEGDGQKPPTPADIEKKMREKLPKLESLVNSAPSSERGATEGLLSSWKLSLDGKNAVALKGDDPWSALRAAQRAIALGQSKTAADLLSPLRSKADPSESWAEAFWTAQLETDRLAGNRAQALKDVAEYQLRFKEASPQLERILASI
jgi:hypothetical protein